MGYTELLLKSWIIGQSWSSFMFPNYKQITVRWHNFVQRRSLVSPILFRAALHHSSNIWDRMKLSERLRECNVFPYKRFTLFTTLLGIKYYKLDIIPHHRNLKEIFVIFRLEWNNNLTRRSPQCTVKPTITLNQSYLRLACTKAKKVIYRESQ